MHYNYLKLRVEHEDNGREIARGIKLLKRTPGYRKCRVIDFIHREIRDTCSGEAAVTSISISWYQLFPLRFLRAPTYSNFASNEISVFGVGAGINRRYYSCNWQSRGNFWPVWNSFLRLYYNHLSFLTSRPQPWWSMRPDGEFVRYYHR